MLNLNTQKTYHIFIFPYIFLINFKKYINIPTKLHYNLFHHKIFHQPNINKKLKK